MDDIIRREYAVVTEAKCNGEAVALRFLFGRARVLRLTESGSDPKGAALFLSRFATHLIRTEQSDRRYPYVVQPQGFFIHHYFSLDSALKAALRQNGLFWLEVQEIGHGLEDPVFYASDLGPDGLVGNVITHERMASLYLTDRELAELIEDEGFRVY